MRQSLQDKIAYSVELLQKAEKIALAYDKENGYFLAFSGGKDSQALYHIAQLAGVKFKAHMNLTSVDPPQVIRFVKKHYPNVELIKPRKSIYDIAIEKSILPTMKVRWCCKEYKENAGAGKVTLIGIRHEESSRRAKRNEVEITNRKFSGNLEQLDAFREQSTRKQNTTNDKYPKSMLNKAQVIGNLGQDPKISVVGNGQGKVASFSVATTDNAYTTRTGVQVPEKTEWHRVVCFGRLAEVAEKYLKKGSKVFIEGKMRNRSYENNQGVKQYVMEIHAEYMEMVDRGPSANQSQEQQPATANYQPQPAPQPQQMNIPGENDTDLPF